MPDELSPPLALLQRIRRVLLDLQVGLDPAERVDLARALPEALVSQIDLSGSAATFVGNLIKTCRSLGQLESGETALVTVLIAIWQRNHAGAEAQELADIIALLTGRAGWRESALDALASSAAVGNYWASRCTGPGMPRIERPIEPSLDEEDYVALVEQTYSRFITQDFTPVRVGVPPMGYGGVPNLRGRWREEDLCTLLGRMDQIKRLLILGPAGAGKTSLLWFMAHEYCRAGGGRVLPIYVSLRYRSAVAGAAGKLRPLGDWVKSFLAEPVGSWNARSDYLAQTLDDYLRGKQGDPLKDRRRLLFLFDDLNRLGWEGLEPRTGLRVIQDFATRNPSVMMVVSSRADIPEAILNELMRTFQVVTLPSWDCAQLAHHLGRRGLDAKEYLRRPDFLSLATSPAQLAQMLDLWGAGAAAPGQGFAGLRALAEAFLTWQLGRSAAGSGKIEQTKQTLTRLAGALARHGKRGRYVEYEDAVAYAQPGAVGADPLPLLEQAEAASVLELVIEERDIADVGFREQLLEDYFRLLDGAGGDSAIDAGLALEWEGVLDQDGRSVTCT